MSQDGSGSAEPFAAYGVSHWVVIAVFALGAAALVWIGRRHGSDRSAAGFSRAFGAATFLLYARR
jgi:hypothetical protein